MFEGIEERLEEIVTIAEKLPERYREKCFEVLLQSVMGVSPAQPEKAETRPGGVDTTRERQMTLIELSKEFKPKGGPDYIVLSAYWLEEYQGKTEGYSSDELIECLDSLRIRYSKPRNLVYRAKDRGYLMAKGDKLLLTQSGLDYAREKLAKGDDE